MNARQVRIYLADPDFVSDTCALKFTLTYEGPLKVGRGKHARLNERKHELRRYFHPQLRRLWEVNFLLANWQFGINSRPYPQPIIAAEAMKARIENFEFIPLVTKSLCVECALDFRILRPTDTPGQISDIDNQVKMLCDGLKIPKISEIHDGKLEPQEHEKPFYVLAQDDELITKISSVNNELLAPVLGKNVIEPTDVRVSIDVYVRPMLPSPENVLFFSEDRGIWDHKYDEAIPESLGNLTNSQLRAFATQCIFRIVAMAHAFESSRFLGPINAKTWQEDTQRESAKHQLQSNMWRLELWPKAFALKKEMSRRIYGEGPYPTGHRGSVAIDNGMLAGPTPLADAATELDSLVRSLPP